MKLCASFTDGGDFPSCIEESFLFKPSLSGSAVSSSSGFEAGESEDAGSRFIVVSGLMSYLISEVFCQKYHQQVHQPIVYFVAFYQLEH